MLTSILSAFGITENPGDPGSLPGKPGNSPGSTGTPHGNPAATRGSDPAATPPTIEPLGNGLINHTWKITTGTAIYVLQQINSSIFHTPRDIAHNIDLVVTHLQTYHPGYYLPAPVPTTNGDTLLFSEGQGYFRLFPFVKGSVTNDVVESPGQAYEAALQFGRFTRLLSGLDSRRLRTTIPSFHDLTQRYAAFTNALDTGNRQRIKESHTLIQKIIGWSWIVTKYENIKTNPAFRLRVTHHDTKISNVLFDTSGKGLCVIDLDTIMPGHFISDMGDMMRTYLPPVSEDEADPAKIIIRRDFYRALVEGYKKEMKDELTPEEHDAFHYSGLFMTYMQAVRFLTDYLTDDIYYGERYPGHNLVRASNQAALLEQLLIFRD